MSRWLIWQEIGIELRISTSPAKKGIGKMDQKHICVDMRSRNNKVSKFWPGSGHCRKYSRILLRSMRASLQIQNMLRNYVNMNG